MFLTFDPNKKPITQKISEKFSLPASKLDCKKIHQILGIQRPEIKVSHLTCGKFIEFDNLNVNNGYHRDFSTTSFFGDTSLNVIGHEIPRLPKCISPRSDRIQKLNEKQIERRMFEKSGDERVKTPKEGFERLQAAVDSNEYPSWDNFLTGLEDRAYELMLVEYDSSSMKLMNELEKLWSVWNSDYWTSFSDDKEECNYYSNK
uniref:Uncharacterized protein n=1 Tax=Panagrolaimus superbus TaxID=310955 RepID=A0A914XW97_9BILA